MVLIVLTIHPEFIYLFLLLVLYLSGPLAGSVAFVCILLKNPTAMTKHILLIDDDPDEIDIVVDAMRGTYTELKIIAARGIAEALEILKNTLPDCIMLDYNMPKVNGIEGLVDIKKIPGLSAVPVIMYSATMDEDIMSIAKELGAAGCVKKPYDMRKLPDLLQPFLPL